MSKLSKIIIESRQKSILDGQVINERYEYEGRAGRVGDAFYISYEQIDENDLIKNLIKVEGDKITRTSKGKLADNTMVFSTGKTSSTEYRTPYGNISMSFFTKNLQTVKSDDNMYIVIEYILSMNNEPTIECEMKIRVML